MSKRTDRPAISYINLPLVNGSSQQYLPARFALSTIDPLISNPDEYELSLVRFTTDLQNVPLWIPFIDQTQGNVNKTVYTVTLSCDGTSQTEALIWTTQSSDPAPPSVSAVNNTGRYYWLRSYQHFVQLLNTALATAHSNLSTAPAGSAPPFFTIDLASKRLQLFADSDNYETYATGGLTPADLVTISCNQPLQSLLRYFDGTFGPDGPTFFTFAVGNSQGSNYQPSITATLDPVPAPFTHVAAVQYCMTQMKSSLPCFSPVSKIAVYATGNIPLVSESSAPAASFGGSNQATGDATTSVTATYLTDFVLDKDVRFGADSDEVVYLPTSEYRMISLFKSADTKDIRLEMRWVDLAGNTFPMEISRYSGAEVKLMLRPRAATAFDLTTAVEELVAALRRR
jgi:hypothetical protein